MKQRVKLAKAYNPYINGVQSAFASGGAFETQVDAKKDKYDLARYTIGLVGFKPYTSWGPGPKAIAFITGDKRALAYLTADDTHSGEPANAIKPEYSNFAKPALIAMLTRGFVLAKFADEAGLDSLRDSIISTTNTRIANYLSGLIETGYTVTLELIYEESTSTFKVHAKVESS